MPVSEDKLESTILEILQAYPGGKGAGPIADWCNRIAHKLGERPSEAKTVAELTRLRDKGLLRLVNYSRAPWWEYVTGEIIDERAFFYTGSFSVIMTDKGRRDVRSVLLQPSA